MIKISLLLKNKELNRIKEYVTLEEQRADEEYEKAFEEDHKFRFEELYYDSFLRER